MRSSLRGLAVILALAAPQSLAVTWFGMSSPQWFQQGSVGLAASYLDAEEHYGRDWSFVGDYRGRTNSSGYLYRPWVLGMNWYGQVIGELQQYDVYANQLQNNLGFGLGASFVLYPVSESPTNLNINYSSHYIHGATDNRFDSFSVAASKSLKFDNASLSNRYQWRHETESHNDRVFDVHELTLNYSGNYEDHSDQGLLRIDYRDASTLTLDNSDLNGLLSYSHSFNYWDAGYSSVGGSYSKSRRSVQQTATDLVNLRFFNNNSWSFEAFPELRLHLGNQMYRMNQDGHNEAGRVDINSLTLSSLLGADYDWSDTLSSNASLMVEDSGTTAILDGQGYYDSSGTRFLQRFGTRFRDYYDLGFASYNLFLGGSINASQGDADSANLGLDFSQGLRRSFDTDAGSLGLALRQYYNRNLELTHADSPADRLGHEIEFNWSLSQGSSNTQVFSRLGYDVSLLQSDIWQQRLDVGIDSSMLQTTRRSFGGRLDYRFSKDGYPGGVNRSRGAVGRLWYREQDLWQIWGLGVKANLDLPLQDYFFNDGDIRNDVATMDIELEYLIGLLEVRFNSAFTENSQYYSVSARRRF